MSPRRPNRRARRRAGQLAPWSDPIVTDAVTAGTHRPLSVASALVVGATAWSSRLRARVGRPSDPALDRRLAVAVAAGGLAAAVTPALGVVVGVAVWGAGSQRDRSVGRHRDDQLIDEVPDLIELFRLAVRAGLTVHLAVRAVAARAGGMAGDALAEAVTTSARGERLAEAIDRWGRCGEPVRPLAAALAAAERYGDPLLPSLERAAVEARMVRRRRAEEAARRLPVQLVFPLVLCVLPAFLLLAVAPLLLAAVPQLPR